MLEFMVAASPLQRLLTAHCSSAGENAPQHIGSSCIPYTPTEPLPETPYGTSVQTHTHNKTVTLENSFNTDFVSYFKMLKTEVPASML